ncbi:MAG TPA: penicillin-binding protein 2 [Phycisphaerales bacterium]|nr:penicillin-binding protein 2 [Phycisphaerales bacterium]
MKRGWTFTNGQSPFMEAQAARIAKFGRVYVTLIIVVMGVLLGRVVQLKISPDERLQAAVGTSFSSRPEIRRTGDLLDREGRPIATSSIGYRLYVDPQKVKDLETIAVDLAKLTGINAAEIDQNIAKRPDSRYVVISQLVNDEQATAVRRANLAGVGLDKRLVRHYPQEDLAAGIVGRVGFDQTGQTGFEKIFNKDLLPSNGSLTYLRDVQRRALWIDPDGYRPGSDGASIRLSVDTVIQDIVETQLKDAVQKYNAGGGRMVVMDCRSGEILAMTDVVNDRPNWTDPITDMARKIDPRLGRDRCVTDPYEPGSTFKPFVWVSATELGKAKEDEVLPTPSGTGWRTPYGRLIRDTHYYGPSTWHKVLVKSMNTGMAMVAERMSWKEMQDSIRKFGFGQKLDIGIPGETAGIMTPPSKWSKYTQTSVSFGHEIAVTPLQMVHAFSAFARDGTMVMPRITAAARGTYEPGKPVITPKMAETTRDAMRDVMTDGTGKLAESKLYRIFGKSGTAQLPRRSGKGYYEDRYVASFICGAPFDHPSIIVLCVLDDPDRSKGHFGGAIAGPVVKDVVERTLQYMGVQPDQPQDGTTVAMTGGE